MKKTLKTMLALMAGALTFAACSNDDIIENMPEQQPASQFKHMIFTATQEQQDGASRAAIATGDVINWTSGDKISIFDGEADEDGNLARDFVLTGGADTNAGTFEGEAATDASAYYGLYPYVVESVYKVTEEERDVTPADLTSIGVDYRKVRDVKDMYGDKGEAALDKLPRYLPEYDGLSDENKAIVLAYIKGEKAKISTTIEKGVQRDGDNFTNIVLPAEQTATAGSADKNAMLMIAKSTDASTMEFKNVCAYVEVKPQFNCSAICLRSNGTEQLAGTLTVNYNNGAPTTTVTANGTNEVLLRGTITSGNTYFIAVRPEALQSGFTIEFLTSDESYYYARTSSKDLGLARNKVTALGTFAADGKWTIKTPTSGDDGDGHSWKLVSTNPVLKLATECAATGVTYEEINRNAWGDKWAYPSNSDNLNGLLYFKNATDIAANSGIMKYAGVVCTLPEGVWIWYGEKNGSGYVPVFTASIAIGELYTQHHDVLYKYVGE